MPPVSVDTEGLKGWFSGSALLQKTRLWSPAPHRATPSLPLALLMASTVTHIHVSTYSHTEKKFLKENELSQKIQHVKCLKAQTSVIPF